MVFSGEPAAKRQRIGTVAIDSQGRTHAEYQQQRRDANAAHKEEQKYSFLNDIRDDKGRRPGDKDYDARRLHVPMSSIQAMTNFEKQYWEIKSQNWDTVLFFKKGKFYELYNEDADIGNRDFDLKIADGARSSMRMGGVPEQQFNLWATRFINAGYKVGRVEQMQSRTQLDREGAKAACVPRELCQVLTLGTLTELEMFVDHSANYIVSIKEHSASYGVVVADTSRGEFRMAHLKEDEQRAELVTLLHSTKPKEILLERGRVSKIMLQCIDKELGTEVRKTYLTPEKEFLTRERAVQHFGEVGFFETAPVEASLAPFWEDELVMSAFGALAYYLRESKQDKELLSIKNFGTYDPTLGGRALVLDGTTLANLEILENVTTKNTKGTLLEHVAHCVSPFGRRRLRDWLCSPLRVVGDIVRRQDAVAELVGSEHLRGQLVSFLRGLPDLERKLNRLGIAGREREVAWIDGKAYNQKIVAIFTETLASFAKIHEFVANLRGDNGAVSPFTSGLLQTLLTFADGQGKFPQYGTLLDDFKGSFDFKIAHESGEVVPNHGKDPQYDAALAAQQALLAQVDHHLALVRSHYKSEKVKYVSLGKDQYLVEVPAAVDSTKKPYKSFQSKSATKTVHRYIFSDIAGLLEDLAIATEKLDAIKRGVLKTVLLRFGDNADCWKTALDCLANVDCLCALATVSSAPGMCRPEIRERVAGEKPYLRAHGVVHPLVRPAPGSKAEHVIANDIILGGDAPCVDLITGPNMGGKSTVMRSACIVLIFAQLGCFVPATRVEMTPTDRIFTRIGANDRILSGLSTFMVEMRETSAILQCATVDSFVVLDELGRGTATVDGYSIAHAVLNDIAKRINCRTMFSTHYHFLCHDVLSMPTADISMHRMAYEIDPVTRSVTFLYKYVHGATNESYGVDVAKKASIPDAILARAQAKADEFRGADLQQGEDLVWQVSQIAKRAIARAIEARDVDQLVSIKRKVSDLLSMK
eukprot:TRINITY_DN2277_c0_g1_i1.p1 TRINITY_DN2277_c0_g1~~TRINITY_DN2277_c0_g1_i1.p1  ORF type:complete len:985 (+),score=320.18 TRINITY_DN2277_c0_g1_i1:66-3020(+)